MTTILITGATGFLGKHLVERLLKDDPEARLRLLCRHAETHLESERVTVVRGDVQSPDEVMTAMQGVDEVYHLAGIVDREPADPWPLYDVHVEGTRNVCEAMRVHTVRKAVFVSTSGVTAVGEEPADRNEKSGYAYKVVWEWPYYLSKIYAEKLASWYYRTYQLPIVHVNPSLLLGPGDDRRSSTGDVEMFLQRQIPVIPVGGLNLVDVRDVADGLIRAMRQGREGERYLLGGTNMTFHEWIQRASKLSGVPSPKLMIPVRFALWGAKIMRKLLPLIGKEFKMDDASIKMSALYWYCDSSKARRELGFTTRDADQTLRDTIDDLRGAPAVAK